MVFCQEQRNVLKEAEPQLAFGKLGKRLGEIWRNMTAEEKQPYEEKAGRDRGRYKQEMTKYQSEQMRQQMESHRMASMQQQQQRQQQQLIAAAQQHDLENRKRARIDVPNTWPLSTQQPMMMLSQMGQMAQLGQLGQMSQMGQIGQMGQMGQMAAGLQPSMLSAGLNINNQQLFSPTFDPRLASLYQTNPTSYPSAAHMSAGMSMPSFLPSGQLGSSPFAPSGSLSFPMTSSSLASPFTSAGLTSLPSFSTSTSSPTPHR